MRFLLLMLLLAGVIEQVQGHAHASEPKSSADANKQMTGPVHVVIDRIDAEKSQEDTDSERDKEQREERRKNIEIGLTCVIAIAAVSQGLFTGLQWTIYRHQLKTSMPLVIIDWSNMVHVSPITADAPDGPTEMVHHFNWGIRNVGATPALIIERSSRFVIVPTSQGIPKMKYAIPKPYVGEPLLPEFKPKDEGSPWYTRLEDSRAFDEIETAYRSKKETLYAFGYVRFRDRYGKKHITKFCLRYYAGKELRFHYDGFGVVGQKENKYT
jgi:hypothetical protein